MYIYILLFISIYIFIIIFFNNFHCNVFFFNKRIFSNLSRIY